MCALNHTCAQIECLLNNKDMYMEKKINSLIGGVKDLITMIWQSRWVCLQSYGVISA